MLVDFREFKFKLGDKVYHISTNQTEARPAIIIQRSLTECSGGFSRLYTVRGLGFSLEVEEMELDLFTL